MQTKIQIKSIFGSILYESEKETLKEAVVEANLYGANLHRADLHGANLHGANLYGANLYRADLRRANLYGANLRGANLYRADLRRANLYGANLRGANLYGANLRGAKNAELSQAYTVIVPEGCIIGWKKCQDNTLVKLLIPETAKRSNAAGRKCRAEFAEVLEIVDLKDKRKKIKEAYSTHDSSFKYVVGETVKPREPWDVDRFNECASGIHFFITRIEAENY